MRAQGLDSRPPFGAVADVRRGLPRAHEHHRVFVARHRRLTFSFCGAPTDETPPDVAVVAVALLCISFIAVATSSGGTLLGYPVATWDAAFCVALVIAAGIWLICG